MKRDSRWWFILTVHFPRGAVRFTQDRKIESVAFDVSDSIISFSFHEFNGLWAYWIEGYTRVSSSIYMAIRLYFTSCILAVTLVPSFRLTRPFLDDELLDQEFLWNAVKVPKQTSNRPSKSTVSYRNNIRARWRAPWKSIRNLFSLLDASILALRRSLGRKFFAHSFRDSLVWEMRSIDPRFIEPLLRFNKCGIWYICHLRIAAIVANCLAYVSATKTEIKIVRSTCVSPYRVRLWKLSVT